MIRKVQKNMATKVRSLDPEDIDQAANIVHKFWSLNAEFEPTIELGDEPLQTMKLNIKRSVGREDQIIIVAESEKKTLLGLARIEIRQGTFYGAKPRGNIVEFYVLPQARRKDVGKDLLDYALNWLKEKGIDSVTSEFPTQNVPAVGFYERSGFRPFLTVYIREI